jgi:hypothetical protein
MDLDKINNYNISGLLFNTKKEKNSITINNINNINNITKLANIYKNNTNNYFNNSNSLKNSCIFSPINDKKTYSIKINTFDLNNNNNNNSNTNNNSNSNSDYKNNNNNNSNNILNNNGICFQTQKKDLILFPKINESKYHSRNYNNYSLNKLVESKIKNQNQNQNQSQYIMRNNFRSLISMKNFYAKKKNPMIKKNKMTKTNIKGK